MGSISTSKSKQELQTKKIPGVFGTRASARVAGAARGQIGQRSESPLSAFLTQALTGGQTAAETGLQSAVSEAVGGGDISQALAPSLIQARGSGIANLLQALGTQQQAGAQGRGQTLQGLLQLAELAMPQVIAGQATRGKSGPPGSSFLANI